MDDTIIAMNTTGIIEAKREVWLMLVVSTFTPAAVAEVKLLDELEFYI